MILVRVLMLMIVTFWLCFATSLFQSPIRIMTIQKPYRLVKAVHSENFSIIVICF
jgi:hypothetical protein